MTGVAYLNRMSRELTEQAQTQRQGLTSKKERAGTAKIAVSRYIRRIRGELGEQSLRPAILTFQARFEAGALPDRVMRALQTVGPKYARKAPSYDTLYKWDSDYTAYLAGDQLAPAPRHTGRVRKPHGWEARAVHLWQQPTKPDMATVAFWLREEGWETATYPNVRRYLKSLPERLGERSPARMGRHYYAQNLRPYTPRDESVLPVGAVYEGDGHTCDVYVAHPMTGNPWRPEFTPWMDVRSHYCVGWYISEAESARSTLFGLSHAIVAHDNVPGAIHVDPGSGFINKIMADEVVGYCARLSIEVMSALPGNAKGKGLTEGWFHHFEERCGKQFHTYCGHDRSDDYLRHLSKKVERGEIVLPTLAQYRDAIQRYVDAYNRNVQKRLGCAPIDLWQQLEPVGVGLPHDAIVRPREERIVRRWTVHLHNRMYRHPDLADWDKRKVIVEYDLHDDRMVIVRDRQGRFICEAEQVDRKPWLEVSRIDEMQKNRFKGQAQRLQQKFEEAEARAGMAMTHDRVLEQIENTSPELVAHEQDGGGALTPPPDQPSDDVKAPTLDIYDTDY